MKSRSFKYKEVGFLTRPCIMYSIPYYHKQEAVFEIRGSSWEGYIITFLNDERTCIGFRQTLGQAMEDLNSYIQDYVKRNRSIYL